MPRDSIRTLVMSAEKDAVKRFISHMHRSWDQLQVETSQELQAMETMTAAFIHKFPRVTPELFVDLSPFIPFMSVSDIMSFPTSLIVNDTSDITSCPDGNSFPFRLTAIRDHSSEMKSLQKKAFVKRLLQSSVVGEVPTWPSYFLSSILPLLPYLPVGHFQQLTSQQVRDSLDGVRGRHVLRTLFSRKMNLTSDNIQRLGVLACYLDPADLGSYLQDSAVTSGVWQQLARCMSKGFISASGRVRATWSFQTLNVSSMAPLELSALSGLLPQLGASFLLSLPSQQLLEVLSQPGLHRYSPAQVRRELMCLGSCCIPTQALGHIAGGMSCDLLSLWTNNTDFAELLQFVSELPGGVRPALVRNKHFNTPQTLYHRPLYTAIIHYNPGHLCVCGALQGSSRAEDKIDGTTLDALGPLLPFLDRDTLALVDRGALALRLEDMRSFCFPKEALRDFTVPVPSCADVRGTLPSAWTPTQLSRMSQEDLKQCVEVFGQDTSLSSEQRRALWVKLSPVRELSVDQVLALGSVATEMRERELQDANLTDLGVPSSFSSNCSMAVLFLREMSLPCTEQQMEALTNRLSSPEAFGPVSAWGPEVFTEIGTLAAGLEDLVLSALVQEQMEGLTPEAIALMSPKKMAVVFSAVQLSWLSAEQAWAVTEEQWAELDADQKHAVGLARYEGDVLLELRGSSSE
uniref:Stereocilin LRR domain-containing protein n=1 Tax=Monopterus albus TaxID=43700 RepID=A0A3Q3IMP4_MONAL